VPDSGYGNYAVHLMVDGLRPDRFRIVSAFEPHAERTRSRLPFFFGFRVYGRAAADEAFPLWRELLGQAVREAMFERWQYALLYTAFSLEAFIDERMVERLKLSGVGDTYIDHVMRVAERRCELHGLNETGLQLSKSAVDKASARLSANVFSPRNQLAHGKTRRAVLPGEVVRALKTTVEFIWDWDRSARRLLLPQLPAGGFESMIDEALIAACRADQ
jgi:hypothetical protein